MTMRKPKRLPRLTYRRWLKVRMVIFGRDGFRCVRCHRPGRIECHHRTPVAAGGNDSPENLVTLCATCHISIHATKPIDAERRAWRERLRDTTSGPV